LPGSAAIPGPADDIRRTGSALKRRSGNTDHPDLRETPAPPGMHLSLPQISGTYALLGKFSGLGHAWFYSTVNVPGQGNRPGAQLQVQQVPKFLFHIKSRD